MKNSFIKIIIGVILTLVVLWGVNYIFFTEEGEIRTTIEEKNITTAKDIHNLNIESYKNLTLPDQYYKKIDLAQKEEYTISFTYNKLLKKGNIDYLERYGENFNK
ncbi:hypothetical protein [Kurthia massiliensis]|uniref:hypothetical protein n=1 Tax=Kurthia massiliensis TaxID=1033739 RepID=UPI000287E932|nr:hypothetical protein [Kurthia massiliensis]